MATAPAGSPEPFQARLQREVERIARAVKADLITLFVYDEQTARFHLPTAYGLRDHDTFHNPAMGPRSGRVAGMVARERRQIVVERVPGRTPMDGPFARREGVHSAAGFPLQSRTGRVVGVLFVSYRSQHLFTDDELRAITTEADWLAEAVTREAPFDELRRAGEARPLADDVRPDAAGVDATLQTIVELTCDSMSLAVGVWRTRPDQTLALVAGYGLPYGYWGDAQTAPPRVGGGTWFDEVMDGRVARLRKPGQGGRFPYPSRAEAAGWECALGLPVESHGRVCGVVEGFSFVPEVDPVDEGRLRRLADLAHVTLESYQREAEAVIQARVVKDSSQAPSLRLALNHILEGAKELTGAASGGIRLVDLDGAPFVLPEPFPEPAVCDCPPPDSPLAELMCDAPQRRIDAPIRIGQEEIGTLYVCGGPGRGFTDHDGKLLHTLAAQAAVALGTPRRLRRAIREIERESALTFDQDRVFREILAAVWTHGDTTSKFAALHLIRRGDEVIEAVYGTGRAADWQGRATHYLEKERKELRDIHVDIALAIADQGPPRVEVISQDDPVNRFDKWIYETFGHDKFVRAFVPLLVAHDASGKVLDGGDLAAWVAGWQPTDPATTETPTGCRTVVELAVPGRHGGRDVRAEIIGTVEVGFEDRTKYTISPGQAVAVARAAALLAPRVYRTTLLHVFQTIVDQVVPLTGAKYASLHFDPADDPKRADRVRFGYEVFSGGVTEGFLRRHPPRKHGLGWRAMCEGRRQIVPDPVVDPDNQLEVDNPEVYAEGVTAMVAVPLRPGAAPDHRPPVGRCDLLPPGQGVLYVGFGAESKGVHRFTPEELEWLELFSDTATDAIRHATAFTQARDKARLLANLQSVAKSLVSVPEDPGKLRDIAWNVLSVLGADVVTIYQYDAAAGDFRTPPAIAGRLLEPRVMNTPVSPADSPALVLNRIPAGPVYAETSRNHKLLDPTRPGKKSFIAREGITSTAAVPLVAGHGTAVPETDGKVKQETVGILYVNYRRPQAFPDDQRKVIESLASSAAVAIKNGRLLEVFWDPSQYRVNPLDERVDPLDESGLLNVVRRAVEYTRAEVGEVRTFDHLRERMEDRCHYPAAAPAGADHPARRAVEGRVMRAAAEWVRAADPGRPCPSALVADYPRDAAGDLCGSEFCVPLLYRDRCLGVLRVRHSRPGAFWAWQEPVLKALAGRAVLELLTHDALDKLKTSEKISTLGGLYATLLHRLKNDVGAISVYAQEAGEEADPETAARHLRKVTELCNLILEQVERLSHWVRSERQRVDVRAAVASGLRKAGVADPVVDTGEALPPVWADPELLAEVVGILAKNGVEAMPEGGRLRVTAGRHGGWVRVRVRDTGPGIDPLAMRTLFQPKHSAKRGGLGIGLWLAHSYAELLGGRLDVDTRPGEGATFILGLPAADPPAPAEATHE